MEYAVVNTKKSSLKVYSTPSTDDKNLIGKFESGTTVGFGDTKIINNVIWTRVSGNGINGWSILNHPSFNYSFLEPLNGVGRAASSQYIPPTGNTQTTQTQEVQNVRRQNSDSTPRETTGVMMDKANKRKLTTVELTKNPIPEISGFDFDGYRQYSGNPDSAMPPQKVQNEKGYPFLKEYDATNKRFNYDYETNYSSVGFLNATKSIRDSINLIEDNGNNLFERYSKFYNRFKVATTDDVLTKTFAHVFFTRPDCNIIESIGSGQLTLSTQVSSNPDYVLEFANNPNTLIQLSQAVGLDHKFMMLPSNRVVSYECKDRSIKEDDYGTTLHGHKIAYGRNIETSLAASDLSITYNDDRDLHLFRMHQLWVEYISAVNRGLLRPYDAHLINKELDYACSAYYFVCAENGEDIIYWSKLYGVFPTTIPDSIMSWNKSQFVTNPEISINYRYSFKKDWKAETLTEFNMLGSGSSYVKTYDQNILSTGSTWVGSPFVEATKNVFGRTVYKLRFRPY